MYFECVEYLNDIIIVSSRIIGFWQIKILVFKDSYGTNYAATHGRCSLSKFHPKLCKWSFHLGN